MLAGLTLNLRPQTSRGSSGVRTNSSFSHSIHLVFFSSFCFPFHRKLQSEHRFHIFILLPSLSPGLFLSSDTPEWLYCPADNRMDKLSTILKSVHHPMPWSLHTAFTPAIIRFPLFISTAERNDCRNYNC